LEVKKNMGWRGRGGGPWPGRGPFSNLPPWDRPGWRYGRGACYWMYNPNLQTVTPQTPYASIPKDQEITALQNQAKMLEQTLTDIKKRLEELNTQE
jgi:hypothetical protein